MGCCCSHADKSMSPPSPRPPITINRHMDLDCSSQSAEGVVEASQVTEESGGTEAEAEALVVVLRVRPLSEQERENGEEGVIEVLNDKEIVFAPPLGGGMDGSGSGTSPHAFTFDRVLGEASGQQDLFTHLGPVITHKALQGINCTLFAYGQTGSGKTHTITGGVDEPGFLPRLISGIFAEAEQRTAAQQTHFEIDVSYLEIYNESIVDLLRDSRAMGPQEPRPHIRESSSSSAGGARGMGIVVDHVVLARATHAEQVLDLLRRGSARRTTAETRANEASSRSHAILTLHITQEVVDENVGLSRSVSKVNVVDLAGSERVKASGAVGERLREGGNINQSLLVLGKVATALTSPNPSHKHVPYRESKLTRLLQDSLGGNAFTVMCCNVSPAASHGPETLNALRFAERVKKIKNRVKVNRDPLAQKMAELVHDNRQLRAYVAALEGQLRLLMGHSPGESDAPTFSETRPFSCPPPATQTPGREEAEDETASPFVETIRLSRSGQAARAASLIETTRRRQSAQSSSRPSMDTTRRGTQGELSQSLRVPGLSETRRQSMVDGAALGSPVKGRRVMSGRGEPGVMAG